MFQIGPLELAVVLVIALLVLVPQRLPDVARSVGRGMREFKNALSDDDDDERDVQQRPAVAAQSTVTEQPAAEQPKQPTS
jgi:sec-independent protein translocase protein TatA